MDTTLKVLQYAMTMEKQGQQFYLSYKDAVEGARARETFESLAKIEEEHYNILKQQCELLEKTGKLEALDTELLRGDQIFENALMQEKAMMDPEESQSLNNLAIMRMAYLIENDFAEFYKRAIDQTTSPQAKALLKILSEWEHQHRDLFYKEYRDLMEANWGDQQFAPF